MVHVGDDVINDVIVDGIDDDAIVDDIDDGVAMNNYFNDYNINDPNVELDEDEYPFEIDME